MWEQTANQVACLLVRRPCKRTLHQPPRVVEKCVEGLVAFLAIGADQLRLVVEGVDMTDTAASKNLDDALDLGLE